TNQFGALEASLGLPVEQGEDPLLNRREKCVGQTPGWYWCSHIGNDYTQFGNERKRQVWRCTRKVSMALRTLTSDHRLHSSPMLKCGIGGSGRTQGLVEDVERDCRRAPVAYNPSLVCRDR